MRADFGTIAHHDYSGTTSDNDFKGSIDYKRAALLGDWFVANGGFRVTAGATFNNAKATMRALVARRQDLPGRHAVRRAVIAVLRDLGAVVPEGRALHRPGLGPPQEPPGPVVQLRPRRLHRHRQGHAAEGLAALASELALNQQGASDLQQESRDFQDEVHKFKAIPQLTIGVGYRF